MTCKGAFLWVLSFYASIYSRSSLFFIHCNENPTYVFLFWELRGLSPSFHIHMSVSDLYIPRIGPYILCSRIGRSIVGIYKSLTDTWMWKLAAQFLFCEYLFPVFSIGSLQCMFLGFFSSTFITVLFAQISLSIFIPYSPAFALFGAILISFLTLYFSFSLLVSHLFFLSIPYICN
jgi:hypothetical protein